MRRRNATSDRKQAGLSYRGHQSPKPGARRATVASEACQPTPGIGEVANAVSTLRRTLKALGTRTGASVNGRWPRRDSSAPGPVTTDRYQEHGRALASVGVAKHREVLLSVGFSTRSTKKLHVQPLRKTWLACQGTRRRPAEWPAWAAHPQPLTARWLPSAAPSILISPSAHYRRLRRPRNGVARLG